MQIYAYILGDNRLHLVSTPKSLGHIRCQSSVETSQLCCCIPEPKRYIYAHEKRSGILSNGNTAILRTCRQAYIEAVDILYRNNIFAVNSLWTLIDFSTFISPQRLTAITRLQIVWSMLNLPLTGQEVVRIKRKEARFNDDTWESFWGVIAKRLTGLEDLWLKLTVRNVEDCAMDLGWTKPLLEVHGLKKCKITMAIQYADEVSPKVSKVSRFERKLQASMLATT